MLNAPSKAVSARLANLEGHLQAENPGLLGVVPTFRQLDKVLYRTGLLDRDESLASRIPWWPLISVLGTFSSGKSTFINSLVGDSLQQTGNQAVDDKFTVVCFGPENQKRVLPGTALDADPRFPFYRMSDEIDKVAAGEGKRIDSYLQLKTTAESAVRGKIFIDSPGFDADDQRNATLRLTDHIIDLSDLVLVMFDARHPEPGAMHDTLQHLVAGTVNRPDAGKFLYILNQIDTTAREDNPEAVVAAWQRAIAQAGLTAGRFYCVYNEEAAVPIEDAALKARFQTKRDQDMGEVLNRIKDVEVERQYRIIGSLEMVANEVEREILPMLQDALDRWRRRTVTFDLLAMVLLVAMAIAIESGSDGSLIGGALTWLGEQTVGVTAAVVGAILAALLGGHLWIRSLVARGIAAGLANKVGQVDLDLRAAFLKNTHAIRSMFQRAPVGLGARALRKLQEIRSATARHIQRLNDLYTDPSGRIEAKAEAAAKAALPPANDTAPIAAVDPATPGVAGEKAEEKAAS